MMHKRGGDFSRGQVQILLVQKGVIFWLKRNIRKNAWNLGLHVEKMGGHFIEVSSNRFVITGHAWAISYSKVYLILWSWGHSFRFVIVIIAKMFACQFQILILSKGNNKTSITSFNCCQYDYDTWWIYVEFRLSNIINHLSKALN